MSRSSTDFAPGGANFRQPLSLERRLQDFRATLFLALGRAPATLHPPIDLLRAPKREAPNPSQGVASGLAYARGDSVIITSARHPAPFGRSFSPCVGGASSAHTRTGSHCIVQVAYARVAPCIAQVASVARDCDACDALLNTHPGVDLVPPPLRVRPTLAEIVAHVVEVGPHSYDCGPSLADCGVHSTEPDQHLACLRPPGHLAPPGDALLGTPCSTRSPKHVPRHAGPDDDQSLTQPRF